MNTESRAGVRGTRGRARFLRAGAIAAALAFAATGAVGASAAPAPGGAEAALPPNPNPGPEQAALLSGAASVAKAKFAFQLPLQVQRVYQNVVSDYSDPVTAYVQNWGFVVSNPGPDQTYGAFPPVTTIVPAFGALPVQTTVYLTQVVDQAGVLDPILVDAAIDKGLPFGSETTVTAEVNVRIGEVSVDEVPLDVGPECFTQTPVKLVLTGKAAGTNPGPGEYNPFLGGLLTGTFTLPPFSGCGSNGQDLDPLLTGTISGPGNQIILNQTPLADYDPKFENNCRTTDRRGRPIACKAPAQPPLPIPANR